MERSEIPYSCKQGRAYRTTVYATAGNTNGDRVCTPLSDWCKANFCSRTKALSLLRKKELLGLSYKGKMYVYDCKNEN